MVVRGVAIHRHHVSRLAATVEVDATCATARSLLGTHYLPRGVLTLTVVHVVLHDIVEAHHVESFYHLAAPGIGNGRVTRGVHEPGISPHSLGHPTALLGILHAPLFVAIAPQNDGGMVTVAPDHILQQAQLGVVDARQTVLVDDQHPLTVADVKQGRCHWVVRGTIGITSQCLQLPNAPCL